MPCAAVSASNKNPLHGVTLERMLNELVEYSGWAAMGQRIKIGCFTSDPSVKSSLTFLRKTPWARDKVESMYLFMLRDKAREQARAQAREAPRELPGEQEQEQGREHVPPVHQ